MKNDFKRANFWVKKYPNGEQHFFMKVHHNWIEISQEIYTIYKNSYQKYYRENIKDYESLTFNEEVYLDQLQFTHNIGEDILDDLYKKDLINRIYEIVRELSYEERKIIQEIYFNDKSERELADELHIPKSTLLNKKKRILRKIKENLGQ